MTSPTITSQTKDPIQPSSSPRPARILEASGNPVLGIYWIPPDVPIPLKRMLEKVEAYYMLLALDHTRGNKAAASRLLGIKRTAFVMRMQGLGLRWVPPPSAK